MDLLEAEVKLVKAIYITWNNKSLDSRILQVMIRWYLSTQVFLPTLLHLLASDFWDQLWIT